MIMEVNYIYRGNNIATDYKSNDIDEIHIGGMVTIDLINYFIILKYKKFGEIIAVLETLDSYIVQKMELEAVNLCGKFFTYTVYMHPSEIIEGKKCIVNGEEFFMHIDEYKIKLLPELVDLYVEKHVKCMI